MVLFISTSNQDSFGAHLLSVVLKLVTLTVFIAVLGSFDLFGKLEHLNAHRIVRLGLLVYFL
jgi:hypothetical protein